MIENFWSTSMWVWPTSRNWSTTERNEWRRTSQVACCASSCGQQHGIAHDFGTATPCVLTELFDRCASSDLKPCQKTKNK